MRPNENRLTIAKSGKGSVYYAWESRAMVPSSTPPARGGPLTVSREYLRAERTTDRRGRPQYLTTSLRAGDALAVGDLVMVRITLNAARALDHVMIEDPRPTGFEVEALVPEGVERPWDAHAEERDDRVAFFIERIESGDTVIEFLVRPEIAGRFDALPVSASGMYDPEWLTRGIEARLDVKGK